MPKGVYVKSEKHKKNISEAMKKLYSDPTKTGMFGKHHSQKTRELIRKAHLGKPSYWKGKKRPDIAKEKHPNWQGGKETKVCLVCGKTFQIYRCFLKKNGNCCSHKCQGVLYSKKYIGINNFNWRGGTSFEEYSIDWKETLKRSIRQRDGYTCRICGKEPSIIVHHIDYDKNNCDPNNLITLCRSCHAYTGGNREHWIKFFSNIPKEGEIKTAMPEDAEKIFNER